jgi:tetratricopeptide (TPR) repeat protein
MRLRWLLVMVACSLGAAGCRGEGTTAGCPSAQPAAPAIDEAVMAFLSAARALHHEADIRERAGDVEGAIAALEKLVAMHAPRAVEVQEVLADAHARLAELRLELGDIDGASHDVETGLLAVQGPTYFRGHLLEVQGRIEEARANGLADAGLHEEATRAKARAVSLLEQAVHVQEQVIERALADGGGP